MSFYPQVSTVSVAAANLGFLSHVGFLIRGEHHLEAPLLLKLFFLIPFAGGAVLHLGLALPPGVAVKLSFVGWVVYTASLFLSITLYRVFFHRLRRFPGPPLMAVSKLTHVYYSRRWDNYKQLEAWRSYGDFVRTGKAPTIKALESIYYLT